MKKNAFTGKLSRLVDMLEYDNSFLFKRRELFASQIEAQISI